MMLKRVINNRCFYFLIVFLRRPIYVNIINNCTDLLKSDCSIPKNILLCFRKTFFGLNMNDADNAKQKKTDRCTQYTYL